MEPQETPKSSVDFPRLAGDRGTGCGRWLRADCELPRFFLCMVRCLLPPGFSRWKETRKPGPQGELSAAGRRHSRPSQGLRAAPPIHCSIRIWPSLASKAPSSWPQAPLWHHLLPLHAVLRTHQEPPASGPLHPNPHTHTWDALWGPLLGSFRLQLKSQPFREAWPGHCTLKWLASHLSVSLYLTPLYFPS